MKSIVSFKVNILLYSTANHKNNQLPGSLIQIVSLFFKSIHLLSLEMHPKAMSTLSRKDSSTFLFLFSLALLASSLLIYEFLLIFSK